MASTLLNEQGFPPDVIELQLAHSERNKVRAAYNKAQRLPERRQMMQAWADYLDELRTGVKSPPAKTTDVAPSASPRIPSNEVRSKEVRSTQAPRDAGQLSLFEIA